MKFNLADVFETVADSVPDDELNAAYIIPSVFHRNLSQDVAAAVEAALRDHG